MEGTVNPLVKVAKKLGRFTATAAGREALKQLGHKPGSAVVCCLRDETVLSASERSRHSEPPALWAFLDADEDLVLVSVTPVRDGSTCRVTRPAQPFGPETTVEMLVHVAEETGENYFRLNEWDSIRRATPVAGGALVPA